MLQRDHQSFGRLVLIFVATFAIAGGIPASAHTIDTTSSWNGSCYLNYFGTPDTETYGQTFSAPNTRLDSFTDYIAQTSGAPVHFCAYVAAWDPAKMDITGPILWQSDPDSLNGSSFDPYTFNPNLSLTQGKEYVAFLSSSDQDQTTGASKWGYASATNDVYTGGESVWQDNGTDFSALSTKSWDTNTNGQDFAFKMNFSSDPVPEPPFFQLAGMLALGGLGYLRQRKKTT